MDFLKSAFIESWENNSKLFVLLMEVLETLEQKKEGNVRFVSFNINGFRTLFHYHPWSKLRTLSNMFQSMKADIITLQELKLARADIDNNVGKLNGYNSFITVPSQKKGYSGVGVYVRIPKEDESDSIKSSLKVIKAEEGLTGVLISHDTKIAYNLSDNSIGGYPTFDIATASKIDSEGRSIVIELSNNIVVISVYCPANSMETEEGEQFRIQFIEALFTRIRNLKSLGKHVVLMGDINISRDLIDSAQGLDVFLKEKLLNKPEVEETFEELNKNLLIRFIRSSVPRMLLNEMLMDSLDTEMNTNGILIDTTRKIQGRRRSMYTVWNTIRNSRPGNYGSRIDLILATEELGNNVSDANIWPSLMGSDHCPIFTDFNVEPFKAELIDSPVPKLESKFAYKLSSRSIDSMFAMAKRKNSPSPLSSQETKKTKSEPTKRSKTIKTQSISNFFASNSSKTQAPEAVDDVLEVKPPPSKDLTSKSLQLSNGRFRLPSEKIPNCKHNEACVLKSAKTPENKGRKFWSCSKPAGTITCPEDKDKFTCNFFQWK